MDNHAVIGSFLHRLEAMNKCRNGPLSSAPLGPKRRKSPVVQIRELIWSVFVVATNTVYQIPLCRIRSSVLIVSSLAAVESISFDDALLGSLSRFHSCNSWRTFYIPIVSRSHLDYKWKELLTRRLYHHRVLLHELVCMAQANP